MATTLYLHLTAGSHPPTITLPASVLGTWAHTNAANVGSNAGILLDASLAAQISTAFAITASSTNCIAQYASDSLATQTQIAAANWTVGFARSEAAARTITGNASLFLVYGPTSTQGTPGTIKTTIFGGATQAAIGSSSSTTTELTCWSSTVAGAAFTPAAGDYLLLEIGTLQGTSSTTVTLFDSGNGAITASGAAASSAQSFITCPTTLTFIGNSASTFTDTLVSSSTLTGALASTQQPTEITNAPLLQYLAQDTFGRVNQSGWGTASDGNVWGGGGAASSALSIASNQGLLTNANDNPRVSLGSSVTDQDVLVSFKTSTFTGSHFGVLARYASDSLFYYVFADGGQIGIRVIPGDIDLGHVSFTATATTLYYMRVRIRGVYIYAKIWAASGSEPSTWNVSAVDSTISSGPPGVVSFASATCTITYTSFLATLVVIPSLLITSTNANSLSLSDTFTDSLVITGTYGNALALSNQFNNSLSFISILTAVSGSQSSTATYTDVLLPVDAVTGDEGTTLVTRLGITGTLSEILSFNSSTNKLIITGTSTEAFSFTSPIGQLVITGVNTEALLLALSISQLGITGTSTEAFSLALSTSQTAITSTNAEALVNIFTDTLAITSAQLLNISSQKISIIFPSGTAVESLSISLPISQTLIASTSTKALVTTFADTFVVTGTGTFVSSSNALLLTPTPCSGVSDTTATGTADSATSSTDILLLTGSIAASDLGVILTGHLTSAGSLTTAEISSLIGLLLSSDNGTVGLVVTRTTNVLLGDFLTPGISTTNTDQIRVSDLLTCDVTTTLSDTLVPASSLIKNSGSQSLTDSLSSTGSVSGILGVAYQENYPLAEIATWALTGMQQDTLAIASVFTTFATNTFIGTDTTLGTDSVTANESVVLSTTIVLLGTSLDDEGDVFHATGVLVGSISGNQHVETVPPYFGQNVFSLLTFEAAVGDYILFDPIYLATLLGTGGTDTLGLADNLTDSLGLAATGNEGLSTVIQARGVLTGTTTGMVAATLAATFALTAHGTEAIGTTGTDVLAATELVTVTTTIVNGVTIAQDTVSLNTSLQTDLGLVLRATDTVQVQSMSMLTEHAQDSLGLSSTLTASAFVQSVSTSIATLVFHAQASGDLGSHTTQDLGLAPTLALGLQLGLQDSGALQSTITAQTIAYCFIVPRTVTVTSTSVMPVLRASQQLVPLAAATQSMAQLHAVPLIFLQTLAMDRRYVRAPDTQPLVDMRVTTGDHRRVAAMNTQPQIDVRVRSGDSRRVVTTRKR